MAILHQARIAIGKTIGAMRHPRQLPAEDQKARQSLCEHCERFEPMPTDGINGAALAWAEHNNTFREHCITADPGRFIHWPVVRKTMYVDASPYLRHEYDFLRALPDFETRWLPVIQESWVGSPPRFWLDGRTSGNRMHMAYHVARFMQETGADIADFESVLEFGGGYGCMAETLHRLGFKGRYIIYDLPIQSGLQRYYLARHGRTLVKPDESGPGVCCVCEPDQLQPALDQLAGKQLFLATWSLSESPPEVRKPFDAATRSFDAALIGYQEQFEQVDNRPYFDKWVSDRPRLAWHRSQIDHLKRSHYLFGTEH